MSPSQINRLARIGFFAVWACDAAVFGVGTIDDSAVYDDAAGGYSAGSMIAAGCANNDFGNFVGHEGQYEAIEGVVKKKREKGVDIMSKGVTIRSMESRVSNTMNKSLMVREGRSVRTTALHVSVINPGPLSCKGVALWNHV